MYGLFIIISIFYSYKEVATGGAHRKIFSNREDTHLFLKKMFQVSPMCHSHSRQ